MTEVNLEYAYLLASTLRWKRFADEKPLTGSFVAVKRGDKIVPAVCSKQDSSECYYYTWTYFYYRDDPGGALDGDLWLYLSDLDVLRVSNGKTMLEKL